MGSDVVFDNPYLDRCLRFSWYLDTIMLLLLGDAFVMFGPDLVANMDDWDYTFYDGWSDVVWFLFLFIFIYHTFDAILGHISLSIDIYRSSWSCMIISTYKIYTETMTCLLSYHDPLVEPLLGHTVKLILSDIVMILWWSYLRRIDSHIIISVEYMSDLLCIHIELLWSHQDGPNVLVAILGHIFLDYPHGRMRQLLYWGMSKWTRCTSCYIGAYFPRLPTWQDVSVAILGHISHFLIVEMIVFSRSYYHFLYSTEGYLFPLLVTISMIHT